MKVILRRAWTHTTGKKFFVGTILEVHPELGKQLIRDSIAKEYGGDYPPKKKPKLNLNFK